MAYTVCLQDWVTISNGAPSQIVIQPEADYIDISDFQDVAAYVEVGSNTNGAAANLDIQSSPTKDESFFGATQSSGSPWLMTFSLAAMANGVQTVQAVRWASATLQVPARFVRWRLRFPTTGTNTTINFRIWLVLNQAGWQGGTSLTSQAMLNPRS